MRLPSCGKKYRPPRGLHVYAIATVADSPIPTGGSRAMSSLKASASDENFWGWPPRSTFDTTMSAASSESVDKRRPKGLEGHGRGAGDRFLRHVEGELRLVALDVKRPLADRPFGALGKAVAGDDLGGGGERPGGKRQDGEDAFHSSS